MLFRSLHEWEDLIAKKNAEHEAAKQLLEAEQKAKEEAEASGDAADGETPQEPAGALTPIEPVSTTDSTGGDSE